MRTKTFANGDLIFNVVDQGPEDGEIVILLHGFPQDSGSWAAVSAELNDCGYRTLAPDQRGYSPLARPKSRFSYRMGQLVGDVTSLIEVVGRRNVHLVGHDWGASVAWSLAAQRPDLVRSLTTVSVPHRGAFLRSMLTSDQALRSYYMALFQIPWLPEALFGRRSDFLGRMMRDAGMTADGAREVRRKMIDGGAMTGALNWYRAMFIPPPPPARRKVRVPTTHVWGTEDPALARRGAELAHKFVDAPFRLEILDGVGHWIPDQEPIRLAEIIAGSAGLTREWFSDDLISGAEVSAL